MRPDFQGILLVIVLILSNACTYSKERIPLRFFEGSMITSNKTYLSANKGCYAYNQDEFGRNPRLVNISWCRKKMRHTLDSHERKEWEIPILPNTTPPLNKYRCFFKTVSNFGSSTPWYIQKRCKKIN
jgi:hypothetical protein